MRFRKLRIAWSVLCGIACVLLIVLWVRSHRWVDQVFVPVTQTGYICLGSMPDAFGVGLTGESPSGTLEKISMPTIAWLFATSEGTDNPWSGATMFSISAGGVTMPYWFGVLLSVAIGTAPWFAWRFSLRTLLIATTLVAAALGLIVWSASN
jgi:hypothetical protein